MKARRLPLPSESLGRNTTTRGWQVQWVPDPGGGGEVVLWLHTGALEVEVLRHYEQNEPNDDDELMRRAGEALQRLGEGWVLWQRHQRRAG